MKIAIYSPYLDTFGGGEKYMMTIAEILSENKFIVDILLGTHLYNLNLEDFKEKMRNLHKIDLTNTNFTKAPIGKGSSFFKRVFFLKRYDLLIYLTDGSIFYSSAKKSFIHFQVPFEKNKNNFWEKIKLSSWKEAIFNSEFTKNIVEKSWGIKGSVIYPPVQVGSFKPLKKKKQILTVGRFFGFLKDKKHKILIKVFKKMQKDGGLKDWTLNLVGGASKSDEDYLNELKKEAANFNVNFFPNASFEKLATLYGQSQIYWHASGYGEVDPKKFEHFGISTVEAMAAGCVPIVINLGGQKEIVRQSESGFLWNNLEELENYTLKVINDGKVKEKLSNQAILDAKKFSKEKFEEKILSLVNR